MNVGLSESDEKYIEILEKPIYVTIAGGSERLVSWNEDVILDGSSSYDPNVVHGNAHDLNFIWHCRVKSNSTLSEIEARGCFGYGKTTVREDSAVKIIPVRVLKENTWYNVTLFAESKTVPGRKSSFHQKIIVRRGTVIKTNIQ